MLQCVGRRRRPERERIFFLSRILDAPEDFPCDLLRCIQERADKKILIDWQFSLEKARSIFSGHYERARQPREERQET